MSRVASILVALLVVAACGGDDVGGSSTAGSDPAEVPASDNGGSDVAEPTGSDEAPVDEGTSDESFAIPDDVCTLIESDEVAVIIGVDAVDPMSLPLGCMWRGADVSATVAIVPTQVTGSVDESCAFESSGYSDVDQLTIAGQPAFAGVDVASVTDTLVVCFTDARVVLAGGLPRDVLAVVAEKLVAS